MGDGGAGAVGTPADLRPRGAAERARTLYYIAAALLAALVPVILFAGLWVRTVVNQGERDLRTYLSTRASTLSERIDTEIRQQLSIMQAIASMESLDAPDIPRFQAVATRMASAFPQWATVSLIDPASGRLLAHTLRPVPDDLPVTTRPEIVGRVVETRLPAVTVRYRGEGGFYEGPVALLYLPVLRENTVRFVLSVGLKAEALQRVLESVREPGLLTVLVDERDRILARSQGIDRFQGQEANQQLKSATLGRDFGFFSARTIEDQEVFTAFERSPLTGWRAVAATDQDRFDQLDERSTWALIGTGIVSLLLAGVLAIFVFYNVVERRVSDERMAASRALSALDARLLATTQEALEEQRKSAGEREVLLREIYHRVKNNLQIIQSLLRLGSRDLKPEQREPFEGAIRRIGAMARVHSLLYNSPDLASVDFKDYLEGLVRETADGFGADMRGIATELDVESMRVPLDTAVPLAFITVEILTNAFKHAFPRGRRGTVTVATRREGDQGILTIADDGVGVPEARTTGRRSLGLHLVGKLVEQIGGTLTTPPPGQSGYRVVFPLTPPPTAPLPAGGGQA
ncbi:MAG TPA: sensor histidine kinase [Microvirga sp.]|jgi:two-component sensor histidine kinase|nr:sensor histidine kinase [Microvirga sp.]